MACSICGKKKCTCGCDKGANNNYLDPNNKSMRKFWSGGQS